MAAANLGDLHAQLAAEQRAAKAEAAAKRAAAAAAAAQEQGQRQGKRSGGAFGRMLGCCFAPASTGKHGHRVYLDHDDDRHNGNGHMEAAELVRRIRGLGSDGSANSRWLRRRCVRD
jgi:hypothetical protein